jgi:CMP/dCMP kinase
MKFTVAIDGPAASGKGTISKEVAKAFGFAHLDSGLLYRAVGILSLDKGRGVIDPITAEVIAENLSPKDLERDDLRTARAARAASKVAVIPEVRAALVTFQRDFARRDGGAVLDGRDIGTVICPEAEAKLFVTASDEVRAKRRYTELMEAGADTTEEQVLADLRSRDARDSNRETAPLKQAEDAYLLDTTELSIDAAVAQAVAIVKQKIEQGRD